MARALICLDENVALDFLSGQLAPLELAEAEHHLAACESCVELLARSAPFLTVQPGPATPRAPRRELSPTLSTLAMKPAENDAGGQRIIRHEDEPTNGGGDDQDLELEEPPTLAAGTVLKDTYKVVGLVGRGGMGEVYEVTHARLAGRYALKLLPPAFALEHVSVTRFRREADITSALRHPNIVQVVDFNHTPAGQPFLVMEFLDGGDLAQLMTATGAMPLERALPIIEQIVSALAAVHRRGIVHRDLKPQNVLLVRGDDLLAKDRVKLVDFGLSKRNESSMLGVGGVNISRERTLLGTPRYMAPEQAAGKLDEIDAKTDQFALGAIVYEMLTGVTAFNGDNMAVLLYRIVAEDPLPMRQFVPTIPEYIERAVMRAMAKQKEDRFPSTRDFLVALAGGDPSTRIPSGLEHEAVNARLVTPRASKAISSSGTAATVAAGERLPRSVEVPPPSRNRAASFVMGLAAALGLALGVQAYRARGVSSSPPEAPHAADPAPTRPTAELPAPPPPPPPVVQEDSPPPPVPETQEITPPAKPLAGLGREGSGKPVVSRARKPAGPQKPKPKPEASVGPPPSAASVEKPAVEKPADNDQPKNFGRLIENF